MLLLMVTQMQNQGIDSSMDTKDMMNQIIQMTVMQSLTEVSQQVEEMTLANVMNYASSRVRSAIVLSTAVRILGVHRLIRIHRLIRVHRIVWVWPAPRGPPISWPSTPPALSSSTFPMGG